MTGTSSNLIVAVRVRPLNNSEKQKKYFQCVFQLDSKRLLLVDPEKYEKNVLRQNRQHERQFTFDYTFGPSATQEDVHTSTTGPIIEAVVKGINATVFAYGATGSGKTYTMLGTKEIPGLMTLLTQALFENIDMDEFSVQMSYLELYNEVIRDLLNPNSGTLEMMEDEQGNVQVIGLSSVRVMKLSTIMNLLQEGNLRRTQEATEANKTSSRSHAVLQVYLMKKRRVYSKLFMIDLAGSERASNTKNRGLRLKEGAAINRSLLALGNVINSLSSGAKTKFINYRDSKLTRLLKESLGGSAKTCMIAHVTQASGHFEETYNTLVYAARANTIVLKTNLYRPASVDMSYITKMNRGTKSSLAHASSTTQLADNNYSRATYNRWNDNYQTIDNNRKQNDKFVKNKYEFSNLFNQLKAQFMDIVDKQDTLRQRLSVANQEFYSLEMSAAAKKGIIDAWEKQGGGRTAESIERLKSEVEDINQKLMELNKSRNLLEKSLVKGHEISSQIEIRLRALATTREQKELIELLVRMSSVRAEKMTAVNDLALKSILLDKADTSMMKLHKYESIAEKLIEGGLDDADRESLEKEYRVMKNQFHFHLYSLREMKKRTDSWNAMLLPRIPSNKKAVKNVLSNKKPGFTSFPQVNSRKSLRVDKEALDVGKRDDDDFGTLPSIS